MLWNEGSDFVRAARPSSVVEMLPMPDRQLFPKFLTWNVAGAQVVMQRCTHQAAGVNGMCLSGCFQAERHDPVKL